MGGVSTQIAYEVPKTVSFASPQQVIIQFPVYLKAKSLALSFSFSHSCSPGTLWSLAQCSTRPWWICWTDALDWDKPAAWNIAAWCYTPRPILTAPQQSFLKRTIFITFVIYLIFPPSLNPLVILVKVSHVKNSLIINLKKTFLFITLSLSVIRRFAFGVICRIAFCVFCTIAFGVWSAYVILRVRLRDGPSCLVFKKKSKNCELVAS